MSPGGLPRGPGSDSTRALVYRALLLAGMCAAVAGQVRFAQRSPAAGGAFMAAAVALAALACFATRHADADAPGPPPVLAPWEFWFLAAATLAAGALRFVALDRWPPGGFFDEAQNVLVAADLLHGHPAVYIGDYTQMPALYFYVLGVAAKVLGQSIVTARLLSAAIGTATVPVFYLLARRLFPGAPAAAAALLLAGSRWHVNFSRVGFTGAFCPLIELLAVLALLRAFERGRRRDWILLGVAVGVGLQTYYAFNLFPLVLAVPAVMLAARAGGAARRALARGAGAAALTVAVLVAPLAVFTLAHPKEFFHRAGMVAIWSPEHHVPFPGALWSNLRAHLLMFNYEGDSNPRHNLAGEPMLGAIEGVLLVLGLGCALGRLGRWRQALPVAWLGVMLLPGILTIEAPQAYRTIGALPAVFLLAAQALQAVGRLAAPARPRAPAPLVGAAFAALALAAGAANAATYFALQVTDRNAWVAFESRYAEVADAINAAPRGYRVWVDPVFFAYPDLDIRLRPGIHYDRFLAGQHLPFPRVDGPGKPPGDLYVLEGFEADLIPLFERAFPHAVARRHVDPFGRIELVTVTVPWAPGGPRPDPALARCGMLGAFYQNERWSGAPALVRRDPAVLFHFHWEDDGLPGHFSADWSARLRVERAGEYSFRLVASDPALVIVDGRTVAAQDRGESMAPITGSLRLAPGEHAIAVRYLRTGYLSALRLWWRPPGERGFRLIPFEDLTPLTLEEYARLRPGLPLLEPHAAR